MAVSGIWYDRPARPMLRCSDVSQPRSILYPMKSALVEARYFLSIVYLWTGRGLEITMKAAAKVHRCMDAIGDRARSQMQSRTLVRDGRIVTRAAGESPGVAVMQSTGDARRERPTAYLEPELRPDGSRDFRRLNGLLAQPLAILFHPSYEKPMALFSPCRAGGPIAVGRGVGADLRLDDGAA